MFSIFKCRFLCLVFRFWVWSLGFGAEGDCPDHLDGRASILIVLIILEVLLGGAKP